MASLINLFEDALRDIYYAEKQIVKVLPKMAKKATSPNLKAAFQKHLVETVGQIERLEEVFALIERSARGKKCPAIEGILEEGAQLLQEHPPGAALDAGMAAAAQAVEHYEIARYSTLVAWAIELDYANAKALLAKTLIQEEQADELLALLATSELNTAANDQPSEGSREKTVDEPGEIKPKSKAKTKPR